MIWCEYKEWLVSEEASENVGEDEWEWSLVYRDAAISAGELESMINGSSKRLVIVQTETQLVWSWFEKESQ